MPVGEKFSVEKYQTDNGTVISLRISADAKAVSTTAIPAYDDKRIRATVSNNGNSRKAGLHSRGFRVGLPAVAPATGYTSTSFIPILSLTDFNDPAEGDFITYQGGQWEIIKKVSET